MDAAVPAHFGPQFFHGGGLLGDQGNLLKLALDESNGTWPDTLVARIDALTVEIQQTQDQLKATVTAIHHQIHPRAAQ